ncbi:MAG: Uma2 family endonuclease [Planctomycetaceae bacterium]
MADSESGNGNNCEIPGQRQYCRWRFDPFLKTSNPLLMMTSNRMTADEFVQRRHELPDGGRWHELHDGIPVMMQAPDDGHGNTVLNLSRKLAVWFQNQTERRVGYACHELGLHVAKNPDTVYVPAICFFDSGQQFGQTDLAVATEVPRLVVDVASANDRRREMRRRTLSYIELGVETIWIPDPQKKEIQVLQRGAHTLALGQWQTLEGSHILPGFEIAVKDVFAQPSWWR